MANAVLTPPGWCLRGSWRFRGCRLVAVLFVLLATCPRCARPREQQPRHMQRWFDNLDSDRDGQLQQQELRKFVGANLGPTDYNTKRKLDAAVEQITGKLDGDDKGFDISIIEVDQYLHRILEGVRVPDWIAHSLGLPQYAQTFKDNAITVLDFPMLVNDGGKLLESELMVTRVLHRQKIMKAMQRQMLGLGVEPGPVQKLECTTAANSSGSATATHEPQHYAESLPEAAGPADTSKTLDITATQAGVITCIWDPPKTVGEPALHKYVLERFSLQQPGARWEAAAELDDSVVTRFTDVITHPGSYQYRLAAWNLYGRSPYVFSDHVVAHTVPLHETVSRELHQQQGMHRKHASQQNQKVLADSVAAVRRQSSMQRVPQVESAACYEDSRVAISDEHLQQQQLQWTGDQQQHRSQDLPRSQGQHQARNARHQQIWHQQQWQDHPAAPSRACQPDQISCSGEECDTALVLTDHCHPSAADRQEHHDVAATESANAAAQHSNPNVIWVFDRGALTADLPTSSAGVVAQAQLLASMQAAKAASPGHASGSYASRSEDTNTQPAGLFCVFGSRVWAWLFGTINSLLLLVLPLMVRLLPVPVLNQLAAAVVRVFHLLPVQLQQRLLLYTPSSSRSQAWPATAEFPEKGASIVDRTQQEVEAAASCEGLMSACMPSVQQHHAAAADVDRGLGSATAAAVPTGSCTTVRSAGRDEAALSHMSSAAIVDATMPRVAEQGRCTEALSPLRQPQSATAFTGISYSLGAGALSALLKSEPTAAALTNSTNQGQNSTVVVSQEATQTAGVVSAKETATAASGQGDVGKSAAWLSVERDEDSLPVSSEECGLRMSAVQKGLSRKMCAFPGCEQQFDLRHFRALRQRHYCGRCQQAFCLQHTAYSTHGASGSCGAESRCVCVDCFQDLTPEYRMFLTTRNTLNSRRSSSGPAGGSSSDGGCSASSRQTQSSDLGECRPPAAASAASESGYLSSKKLFNIGGKSRAYKSSPNLQQHTAGTSPSRVMNFHSPGRRSQPGVGTAVTASASSRSGGLHEQVPDSGDVDSRSSVMGKMLWARGLAKAKAVVRFKQAGQHRKQ